MGIAQAMQPSLLMNQRKHDSMDQMKTAPNMDKT